jgi:hypothetical protein
MGLLPIKPAEVLLSYTGADKLLDERGIIAKKDVLERIKALQASVQSSRKIQ